MPALSFFRDIALPSHRQDRVAHERFLLDTYAERRAEDARPPREPPAWLTRLLTFAGLN